MKYIMFIIIMHAGLLMYDLPFNYVPGYSILMIIFVVKVVRRIPAFFGDIIKPRRVM